APAPAAVRHPEPAGGATDDLTRTCERGLADIDLLTIPVPGVDGEDVRVPAAGIPWFLTLFGRDSLLTAYFLLPYRPATAAAVLSALAATQGRRHDPFSGEQPGRIVHETRHGELAHFRQVPYGRYYGAVDATPLFLVLLHAHHEATGDPSLAKRLERHARRAVDWMLTDGGLEQHGYLVYDPDPGGLVNQNWKDSAGAVCFRGGTQAEGPVAVCEAQGYAYDALLRTAELADGVWRDEAYARRLREGAARLRDRFTADFWMTDADFPALALDGDGRQVDALASDAGHLLWSGILDPERSRRVGRRLLEPDFFSGWAIRTLAAGQRPYHPLSYHRGSAWPHDNAVVVLGLARQGLAAEVRTVAEGRVAAAAHHGHRLPEVLAGYDRAATAAPVPYPHSCSPQAWAAATPLALRTALGPQPPGSRPRYCGAGRARPRPGAPARRRQPASCRAPSEVHQRSQQSSGSGTRAAVGRPHSGPCTTPSECRQNAQQGSRPCANGSACPGLASSSARRARATRRRCSAPSRAAHQANTAATYSPGRASQEWRAAAYTAAATRSTAAARHARAVRRLGVTGNSRGSAGEKASRSPVCPRFAVVRHSVASSG
uniref:amylo-alpha-1,6-glucosidase n=1 Tax=Streptomyces sp. E5N91 TaxID=1851996 RepID=UPI001EE8EE07